MRSSPSRQDLSRRPSGAQRLGRLRASCDRDIGLVEILAFAQQCRPMVFRHRVCKAVAEIELRRMPPPPPVTRERGERRPRLLFGDRDCTNTRHPEELANILLGFLDTRMPLAAN